MALRLAETFISTVCISRNSNTPYACVGTITLCKRIMHGLWIT